MGKKKTREFVVEMHNLYLTGMTTKEVGIIYGVTAPCVQSHFKRHSLEMRLSNRYSLNEDYFELIDTPQKAYVVGFLAADGNVDKNRIRVKVSKKDVSVIEFIKKELNSSAPIHYRAGGPISGSKYTQADYCYIRLCSRKMVRDLIAIGITPNKSLVLKPPKNIPEGFVKYFILGYFDGDGTIYDQDPKNPRFSMLGTFELLSFMQNHLITNAGLTMNVISKKYEAGTWQLGWGGPVNAIKFREYVYDTEDEFSLARKRDRFFTVNTKARTYKKGRTVIQYDLDGNFIKEWDGGVKKMPDHIAPCKRNIYDAIARNGATAYGYQWKYKQ